MRKIIVLAIAALLWSNTALAASDDAGEATTGEAAPEFATDEVLSDGFITHQLNRYIASTMTDATGSAGEKASMGRTLGKYMSAPKFGGYVIGTYKYSSQSGAKGGPGFGVRLARVYVDGTILRDFKYRLQFELNGTPNIKDYYIDWSHWKELGIKIGQFKRSFTFENPLNPWNVGVGDYSQLVKRLAGMGDYNGEASMGGRDQGLQVHGDIAPIGADRHRLLHYEVGIYNGQGINATDKNKRKDLMGSLQLQPVKNLMLGFFGWTGNTVLHGLTVDRKRWAVGVKYETDGWSARAEYGHSKGKAVKSRPGATYTVVDSEGREHEMQDPDTWYIDESNNKADAWYMTLGVPCTPWLKVFGKWDAYRRTASNSSLKSIYSLAPNFQLHKNLLLQLQYNYVHDKTLTHGRDYSELWVETYFRF